MWLVYTHHGIDIARYPAIKRHLLPFKKKLEERATEQPWYELQQPQYAYVPAFEGPKIVYPDIAKTMQFAWDESGSYLGNTNYCIPAQPRFLCAMLNSKLLECIHTMPSKPLRGGYLRFFTDFVQDLPIVEPSEADKQRLSDLVDQLQALGGVGPQTEALEREVDEVVYRTYGLSADEVAEIERWHAERRALLGNGKRRGKTVVTTADQDADQPNGEEEDL